MIASFDSVTKLYHNDSAIVDTVPDAPTGLIASGVTTSSVVLSWNEARDTETVSSGLSYNLRVGTAPGTADVVGPMANTDVLTETSGLRRLPALGPERPSLTTTLSSLLPGYTYYWSVQAIDTAWVGGPFGIEGQFTTAPITTPTPGPSATATAVSTVTSTPSPTAQLPTSTSIAASPTPVDTPILPTPTPGPPNPSATAAVTATRTPSPSPTAPLPTATATPCTISFSDARVTDYFYEPVRNLYCRRAITGYADGTFRPYNNATRGQLSKIVVLAEAFPIDTSGGPHFSDVPTTNPFYAFIKRPTTGAWSQATQMARSGGAAT